MTCLIKDNTYDVNIDAKQTNEGYAVFNLVINVNINPPSPPASAWPIFLENE